MLRYQQRFCIPNVDGLRDRILEEEHGSRYSIYMGSTKLYHDLMEIYLVGRSKNDIAEFVAKCPNCQQVKAKQQKSGDLLQKIQIVTWK